MSNLLRQLKKDDETFVTRSIPHTDGDQSTLLLLEGRKIFFQEDAYYMISFITAPKSEPSFVSTVDDLSKISYDPSLDNRVVELEHELKTAKENLAATIEELESANEELQSSNEELIASNEELQSTNEELQSVNEELYTVNTEHQQKIEELTRLNNDINNLLKNTEVAAIYLDSKLRIRKITPQAQKITNILPSDIGRPLSHLSLMDSYSGLFEDVESVIDTLQPIEREVTDSSNHSFFTRIRPYRTENNAVDGVLITLLDISELHTLRKKVIIYDERLDYSLDLGKMAWWEWNVITGKVTFNERKATMLGYSVEEFPTNVYDVCNLIHPDDYERTMNDMKKVLTGESKLWNTVYRIRKKNGSYAWYHDQGSIKSRTEDGKPYLLIGMVIDVSERENVKETLQHRTNTLDYILQQTPTAIVTVSNEGELQYMNEKARTLLGVPTFPHNNITYDHQQWHIESKNGAPLSSEELPFSLIKKTKSSISNFEHYITYQTGERVLLSISGTPLLGKENSFEGAVFVIREVDHE